MIKEDEKKKESQKSWLKEHDSIQVDLLKMKDELAVEVEKDKKMAIQKKYDDRPKRPERKAAEQPPPRTVTETDQGQYQPEMTIKQMLNENENKLEKSSKDRSPKEPPRLEQGTIPSSPELTSKIASVLQLENKLKRRKFELEKRSSKSDIPPPPKKPKDIDASPKEKGDEERDMVNSKGSNSKNEKAPKGRALRSEAVDEKISKKQIHISSEMPYPSGMVQEDELVEEEEEEALEELEEFEEVEEPKQKKKKRRGIFSLFSKNR